MSRTLIIIIHRRQAGDQKARVKGSECTKSCFMAAVASPGMDNEENSAFQVHLQSRVVYKLKSSRSHLPSMSKLKVDLAKACEDRLWQHGIAYNMNQACI